MTKTPKIWIWGGAPEGEGELLCGGGPTEEDLFELYKALHGHPSRYGPSLKWTTEQEEVSVPIHLLIMLSNLVDWNIRELPWTQERKDWLRAAYVAEERAKGKSLEEACEATAARLAEGETVKGIKGEPSPAAIGTDMIKKSYLKVWRFFNSG